MILKYFVVLSLYFLTLVSALSKSLNQVQIHDVLRNMLQTVVFDHESTTTDFSTTEEYYDEDVDKSIENFLTHSMQNYKQWLAIQDPLSPFPEEVILDSKDLREDKKPDIDAILKISNQYMANHSKYEHANFPGESTINSKMLQVNRVMVEDNHNVTFGGDYNVSGILKVSPTLQVNFSGEGHWNLKGNRIRELLFYVLYKINNDGYIDLASTEYKAFSYSAAWNEWEFEGLEIDHNGAPNPEWEQMIKDGLRQMYSLHLNGDFGLTTNPPPKLLLDTYLQDRFMSTNLVDIISDWQTMPTTPATKTSSNPPHSQGQRNAVIGHCWIVILTLLTFCSVV